MMAVLAVAYLQLLVIRLSFAEPILSVPHPAWVEEHPVEVYYGELLMSSWVLDHAPWNAYHSGLAFLDTVTSAKALFDYVPLNTSSVSRMLVPEVVGGYFAPDVRWHNAAETLYHDHWPTDFGGFVRVGFTNGLTFNEFFSWVQKDFAPTHKTFDPLEVASRSLDSTGEAVPVSEASLPSNMCHDFVTAALWQLHNLGVHLHAEEHIFRDHIIMYGKAKDVTEEISSSGPQARHRLRYLRTLHLFLEQIKEQFTFGRDALIALWKMGVPAFVRLQNRDYVVELDPPFLNYCYLPLAIPPKVANPFESTKLCALPMVANVTNVSVPWPWGVEIAVEHQLDQPDVWLSLLAVVLVSFLCSWHR